MFLLRLQKEYDYDLVKLYKLHKQDYKCYEYVDIVEDDYHSWIHHFIIFTHDGNVSELSEDDWNFMINESEWQNVQNHDNEKDKQGETYSPLFLFLL